MGDTAVCSWDEFIKKVAEIQNECGFKQYGDQKTEDKVLFRGLGDAEWPLLTTLERYTAPPFIAAFFALEQRIPSAKEATVLAYVGVSHLKSAGLPNISVQTHYLSTHKRHFLQQAWYTICTRFLNNSYTFARHEEALGANGNRDMLFKIRIPRTMRLEFLLHLSEMNINYFSLFQSDESLVKTLAFNEIDAQNR